MFFNKKLITLFLLQDMRENFPNMWSKLGYVFGIFFELLIYWYTAKAFGPKIQEAVSGIEHGYFNFVVFGEIVVLLPTALLASFVFGLREAKGNGVLEVLLTQPLSSQKVITTLGLGSILRAFLHMFFIIIFLAIFFGFIISASQIFWVAALQIMVMPLFYFLGLSIAGLFLRFGRGAGITAALTQAAAVVAGVYFPTNVFPVWFKDLALYLSPYNALLELSRGGPSEFQYGPVFSILIWTMIAAAFCFWIIPNGIYHVRKRGSLDLPNT